MTLSPVDIAQIRLEKGLYAEAVTAYEQALEVSPDTSSLYWNYGIALLLNGQEEEAQSIWMSVLLSASSEAEQKQRADQLVQALESEIQRCEVRAENKAVWILRRYQCEFALDDPKSLQNAVLAGLRAEMLSLDSDEIDCLGAIADQSDILFTANNINKTEALLQLLLDLDPKHSATQRLVSACIRHVRDTPQAIAVAKILRKAAWEQRHQFHHDIASILIRSAIQLTPTDLNLLGEAIDILRDNPETRLEAIALGERLLELASLPVDRLWAMDGLILRLLYSGGPVQRVHDVFPEYETQLSQLADSVQSFIDLDPLTSVDLIKPWVERLGNLYKLTTGGYAYYYFADAPQTFRPIRNRLAAAAQSHTQMMRASDVQRYRQFHTAIGRTSLNRSLRIGYLASTFRQHSVGWLCRWLLKHHDRDRFDVHLYTSTTNAHDFVQEPLMRVYGDRFHVTPVNFEAIANCIFEDQIDILVELDSMTDPTTLSAVSLKPAPVQVSWLGFDASGLPAIDYFIADPYVLPDDAESYYQEKIWRLPSTYIAVDGFEAYTPTLRRSDLEISDDAIVYLSSQTGFKRNPHNVKLQLQVLKSVPNSVLLIKSTASDPTLMQSFFYTLAEEMGVSGDRLRFLPDFPLEFTYRANLQLADVVLDTYPYNGATTTLEALWMGLPIVTRVGEQFAARNSYTMMMNAGITEGIAWNDEDYVEWGIRLGKDETLRRDVVWKLLQSQHTAPLWNAKQFTREMEHAYEQMWQAQRPV